MEAYDVNWEGAYDAWEQSGLSRMRFIYSELFKPFLRSGPLPSEDAVRSHFRNIRNQRGDWYERPKTEPKPPLDIEVPDTVQVFKLDPKKVAALCRAEALPKNKTAQRRLRQVIIRMPDGRTVEFESRNVELFALKLLCCREDPV